VRDAQGVRRGLGRLSAALISACLVATGCADDAPAADGGGISDLLESVGHSDRRVDDGSIAAVPENTQDAPILPTFEAVTLDGRALSSAQLVGPTVIWVWEPWCPHCRAEGPSVAAGAELLRDEVDVVGVVGVHEARSTDEFIDATGTGKLVHVVDTNGVIGTQLGVTAIPSFVFIDGDGRVVDVVTGRMGQGALVARARQLSD
jgi:thiol-disulfide isomerase/thioredoxin